MAFLQVIVFWTGSRLTVLSNAVATSYFLYSINMFTRSKVFVFLVFATLVMTSITFYRWFGDGGISSAQNEFLVTSSEQNTIDYLQSYFAGHSLISNAVLLADRVNDIQFYIFVNEIISSWLFVRQVFPPSPDQSTVLFNKIYGFEEGNSMILPTLGQSFFYFDIFGFFVLPFFFSFLLIYFERGYILSSTLSFKYAYVVLISWFAFFPMQNINIISATLFNVAGPLFLFSYLNSKIRF
ncbi:hypothetical protein [Nitritalea halalkaliphila]|uniref:hypothetical protein n=1 Tax=Nitritalea halalkaliphila TaxID=590849 RepID=UPI0012EAC723|nr:hypothetical protein [Nitritalea halalkaliphila]